MKKSVLILAPLALLAAAACNQLPETANPDRPVGKQILFTSSIGQYTKAGDTSFDVGDVAILSIGDPVKATGVKITYADGNFTPEKPLYWALGQEDSQKSSFAAAYPADACADPLKAFTFTVPADQGAAGAYEAADLLTAWAEGSPADASIHLAFGHSLSRLVIALDNKSVSTDPVERVELKGVQAAASVDIAKGTVAASGEKVSVNAALISGAYVFVVPPQTVSPEVVVTLKSGGQITLKPAAELAFASGKQITATATIEDHPMGIFTGEISDWLSTTVDIVPQEPEYAPAWSVLDVEGNFLFDLEAQEDGLFTGRFYNYNYRPFLLCRDDLVAFGNVLKSVNLRPDQNNQGSVKLTAVSVPDGGYSYYYIRFATTEDIFLTLDPVQLELTMEVIPHEWEDLGKGKLIDGFVAGFFYGIPDEEVEVLIQSCSNYPGVYRILDPYSQTMWAQKEWLAYEPEEAELIFHIEEDGRAWFEETYLGTYHSNYGYLYGASLVPEVGFNGYDYYGSFDAESGFVSYNLGTVTYLSEYGYYYSNERGMMGVTLPGGTRPVQYVYVKDLVAEPYESYMNVYGYVGLDVTSLKYAVLEGELDAEAIAAAELTETCTPDEDYYPGYYVDLIFPMETAGWFTCVFEAAGADGTVSRSAITYEVVITEEPAEEPASVQRRLRNSRGVEFPANAIIVKK